VAPVSLDHTEGQLRLPSHRRGQYLLGAPPVGQLGFPHNQGAPRRTGAAGFPWTSLCTGVAEPELT
jgi:hypothetical protein